MSAIAIYAILLVVIISICIIKNEIDNRKNILKKAHKMPYEKSPKNDIILELDKSLRHLEYLNRFEKYLETLSESALTLEFLQGFEKSKQEAHKTILMYSENAKLVA